MTTAMFSPVSARIGEVQLEPWPLGSEQVVEGDPQASGTVLWTSSDETLCIGIWQCTPGVFDWTHVDETLCVVRGRATIQPEKGDPIELEPGVVAFFPEGTRTRWTVHETVRKAFNLHASQPIKF